jgi:hypothetical protein
MQSEVKSAIRSELIILNDARENGKVSDLRSQENRDGGTGLTLLFLTPDT